MSATDYLPSLTVEVNFEGAAGGTTMIFGDADTGRFGTGTFAGGLAWADVTSFVRSGEITRGSTRFEGVIARAEPGKASIVLDNRDGRFDPLNAAGPYVAAGVSQVQPMRAFRIRADGYDLFRGYVDAWTPGFALGGNDATTTLAGTDGTKVLAGFDGPALGVPVGAGEDTGARIARILDNAGWDASLRDLDVGKTSVTATSLDAAAWTEILLTADTEIGEVYFDGAGRVVFRNRDALRIDARSITPQAVFGDDDTNPAELGYIDPVIANDDDQIANLVRIQRPGGVEQIAEDTISQARYLVRTFERSDLLLQTDAEAADYAAYVLELLKTPDVRIAGLGLLPQRDPAALYPQALGRELGDRITVIIRPPGGYTIERDCLIRGIGHAWTTASWSTVWTLQDTTRFDQFLILDHAEFGLLDTGRLGY